MTGIRLDPLDTLFFRDGTPFSIGTSPQQDVTGRFPPYAPTVVGALRAALARQNGWKAGTRWPERLDAILGNGPEDLGSLAFEGPFVLRDDKPLFKAPRHVLGRLDNDRWVPRVLLRPGRAVKCDLGDAVQLPEASEVFAGIEQCRTGDRWWLTQVGMQSVLDGRVPGDNDVVPARDLWREEMRVGLERDRSRRTAEDGKLYSSRHVRLQRGVSIGMRIGSSPRLKELPSGCLVPLGGESRVASCERWDVSTDFSVPTTQIESSGQVAVVALSPLELGEAMAKGRRQLDVPGGVKVISACLGRPERIGGWDSLARAPLPLCSVLPSGSVLFCRAREPQRLIDATRARGGVLRLGQRQAWGFGVAALGVWPDQSETNS